jgi:hypothetical protein
MGNAASGHLKQQKNYNKQQKTSENNTAASDTAVNNRRTTENIKKRHLVLESTGNGNQNASRDGVVEHKGLSDRGWCFLL